MIGQPARLPKLARLLEDAAGDGRILLQPDAVAFRLTAVEGRDGVAHAAHHQHILIEGLVGYSRPLDLFLRSGPEGHGLASLQHG